VRKTKLVLYCRKDGDDGLFASLKPLFPSEYGASSACDLPMSLLHSSKFAVLDALLASIYKAGAGEKVVVVSNYGQVTNMVSELNKSLLIVIAGVEYC
jgi:hypothetical protein